MSARVYLNLIRPRRLAVAIPIIAVNVFLLHSLPLWSSRPPTTAFAWWVVVMPITLGWIFAQIIHEPMHRPFSIWLPNARRQFARWHTAAGAVVVGLGAAMIVWLSPHFPLGPCIALAAACYTLPVLANYAPSSKEDWIINGFIGAIAVAALRSTQALASLGLNYPWATTLLAGGATALGFASAFSRRALRQRATRAYTSIYSRFLSLNFAPSQPLRLVPSTPKRPTAWSSKPLDVSLATWRRVLRYERSGRGLGSNLRQAALAAVLIPIGGFLFSEMFSAKFGQDLYRTVWEVGPLDGVNLPLILASSIGGAGAMIGFWRPRFVYPVSRARQARVVYWESLTVAALLLGLLATVVITLSGALAWRHGWPTPLEGVLRFIVTVAWLGIWLPLAQWGGMHRLIRGDQASGLVYGLFTLIPNIAVLMLLRMKPDFVLSIVGLVSLALALVGSQLTYFRLLQRFYRQGDLVQRGTSRQNFSLI